LFLERGLARETTKAAYDEAAFALANGLAQPFVSRNE
jgi:hypothetical protein